MVLIENNSEATLPYILSKLETMEKTLNDVSREVKELREDVQELREQHARTDVAVSFLRNGLKDIKNDIDNMEDDIDDIEEQHIDSLREWKSFAFDFGKMLAAAFIALLVNNFVI
jgi:septal ring factor EnvC (AmiA/AmiB activator)